ncbi:MAG: hypothetical protein ACT4TC_10870 [Myxococcaceae bacterium]
MKQNALRCLLLAVVGCGGGTVSSDEQARRAYLGLDVSVGKALQLGFDGFNAAQSANIPAQSSVGVKAGTLTVTGQVDQGASANKGMRLRVGMVGYSDGPVTLADQNTVELVYQTQADPALQPALDLSLRDIPNGTFSGTLKGIFQMSGDLAGDVLLDLTFTGEVEDDGTGKVRRKGGSTHVAGTATSVGGSYTVDVTR